MGSVSLTHLIGTVSLMLIFLSVGSYYSMSIASLKNEVVTVQLSKIANYIGSDIVDLVSLCYIGELDQLLIKNLTLPAGLTAYGYNMTVEKIGQNMVVRIYLISDSLVYGEYTLPWSTESNIEVYDGSGTYPDKLTPTFYVDNLDTGIVIWCTKIEDQITIGLGLMS
jgi:hypothetical protein